MSVGAHGKVSLDPARSWEPCESLLVAADKSSWRVSGGADKSSWRVSGESVRHKKRRSFGVWRDRAASQALT